VAARAEWTAGKWEDELPQAAEQPAIAAEPSGSAGAPAAVGDALRQAYWEALTARDARAAWAAVEQALDAGVGPEGLLLDLVAEAQRRIGAEWAAAGLTVAQEHAATAIGDRVIAAIAVHPAFRKTQAAPRGRVTVACTDGEWHAMPARLVAEVLTLRGWQVDFLGAHVPGPHLIAHIHASGPDVIALSASLAGRLPAAHAVITACQATGVPVVAGGAAFGPDGRYARMLGADAWAGDARAAADILSRPLPHPKPPHQAVDDLPHLADQEYTALARGRAELVAAVLTELPERFPAMRAYDERQMQHTAEDIGYIVEYLACAVYLNDMTLFTGFCRWTREILAARGVPPHALAVGLLLVRERVREFPRAYACLGEALADLDGRA
jgi:methanogenic corrinoid protein MtbC1